MNTMKNLPLSIMLSMLVVLSALIPGAAASAAEAEVGIAVGDVTDPGILPDSGFYFMKSWGRNLQLMFAGSDAEKARLMIRYASEDALALQKMYQAGKYDVAERQAGQYSLQLQMAMQMIEQVRNREGKGASEELVERLQENYLRQQEVLLGVASNAPEAAQKGLLNAIENSNRHVGEIVISQQGEQALEQYQEQVNQQTQNMGQETRLRVQEMLQVKHGQAGVSQENGNLIQVQAQTQVQAKAQSTLSHAMPQVQIQAQTETQAHVGQPATPVQTTGQSGAGQGGGQGQGGKK